MLIIISLIRVVELALPNRCTANRRRKPFTYGFSVGNTGTILSNTDYVGSNYIPLFLPNPQSILDFAMKQISDKNFGVFRSHPWNPRMLRSVARKSEAPECSYQLESKLLKGII